MKIKTYLYDDWSKFAFKGDNNKDRVIEGRFNNACDRFQSALFCFEEEMYDASADRLYFSWLYGCRALLLSIGKETANIHILFLRIFLYFVSKGIIPRKDYDTLLEVYNLNQKNFSYDMIRREKVEVQQYLEPTKEFLRRIESILNLVVK